MVEVNYGDLEALYKEISSCNEEPDLGVIPDWETAKMCLPKEWIVAIEKFRRENPDKSWKLDLATGEVTEQEEDHANG